MAGGPVEVVAVCESVLAELAGAISTSALTGSREEWAAAVTAAQRVIDVASAVQDAAIARLAAIEPEWLEDGTVTESHRGLGHAALDAPAIVSGVLNVAAVHAERRVRAALALAADGPAGTSTATGLGGLHQAMATGRLDAYRASVVAEELVEAPPEVAATVVAALEAHFDSEDAAHLRRRCRRVLTRISPDLLVQRARRARQECGLRRWADEPGVDRWVGTFPSEEAAQAWAAIDALARTYVQDQVCPNLERARAKALTDLVAGHATIDTVLTVTVPATVLPETVLPEAVVPDNARRGGGDLVDAGDAGSAEASPAGEGDLVEVTGPSGAHPVYVARSWLTTTAVHANTAGRTAVQGAVCHPATGALLDDTTPDHASTGGLNVPTTVDHRFAADESGPYRPSRRMATRIKARDRRCRFPGCTIAATFCDLDHVRPWPHGPTHDTNLLTLCRRHHRIKQRPGWNATLAADGVATWTDPTGRVRTTHPADALHTSVLPDVNRARAAPGSTSRARTALPDGPHSELEFHLEHLTAPLPGHHSRPVSIWRDHHGNHRAEVLPITGITLLEPADLSPTGVDPTGHWPCRRTRRRASRHDDGPPPF
ncbi:MAG TPA: hypothetical protein VES93_16920 [Ornithinibacter sp.]|nr:hypothetical protein [Ornithinibacter sp.]